MIPLSIQEVHSPPVEFDVSSDGNTLLVLVYLERKIDEYINRHHELNGSSSKDSMIVHDGQYHDSDNNETEGEGLPYTQPGIGENVGNASVTYRAQRKYLCLASNYFKNLFTGPWFENTQFEREGGIKFYLWEEAWDRNALRLLLHIMHFQFHHIPDVVHLKLLENMLIIADYLICTDFLGYFFRVWGADALSKYRREILLGINKNAIVVMKGLVCTYISCKLDLREEFRMATKALAFWAERPITNSGLSIDQSIIDAINSERERMLGQIIEPLKTEILNLALHSFYACQQDPHASVLGFLAAAFHMKTLLRLNNLSELPSPPYIGYNVVSVADDSHELSARFPGLNIDDFRIVATLYNLLSRQTRILGEIRMEYSLHWSGQMVED